MRGKLDFFYERHTGRFFEGQAELFSWSATWTVFREVQAERFFVKGKLNGFSWHWNCGVLIKLTKTMLPFKTDKITGGLQEDEVVFLPPIGSEIRCFIFCVSRKTVSRKEL
jgi:hypothetical protein